MVPVTTIDRYGFWLIFSKVFLELSFYIKPFQSRSFFIIFRRWTWYKSFYMLLNSSLYRFCCIQLDANKANTTKKHSLYIQTAANWDTRPSDFIDPLCCFEENKLPRNSYALNTSQNIKIQSLKVTQILILLLLQ